MAPNLTMHQQPQQRQCLKLSPSQEIVLADVREFFGQYLLDPEALDVGSPIRLLWEVHKTFDLESYADLAKLRGESLDLSCRIDELESDLADAEAEADEAASERKHTLGAWRRQLQDILKNPSIEAPAIRAQISSLLR